MIALRWMWEQEGPNTAPRHPSAVMPSRLPAWILAPALWILRMIVGIGSAWSDCPAGQTPTGPNGACITTRPPRIIFGLLIRALSITLLAASASAQDNFTVTSCPGQPRIPVTFQIDCSHVKSLTSKQHCKPFIENEACRVFFAYRKITGIELEKTCPSIKYTIYDKDSWPAKGEEAGGLALKCAVEYMAQYSVDSGAASKIGPYDTHELLHVYQAVLGALPDAHILFGPSQAEAMREIGDVEAADRAIARMKAATLNFEDRFAKLAPRLTIDKCVLAELQTEATLYLEDSKNVYRFYRTLVRSFAKNQADREARFNRMYDAVSGGRSRQFLLAHGCAPF